MKKLFGLLISIWIPLYLLFALLSSCEKSTFSNESPQTKDATSAGAETETQKNTVLGSWLLVEYYEDRGDGTGQWIKVQDPMHEDINFYTDGSFRANSTFSIFQTNNYTHYTIVDSEKINLSSSSGQNSTFRYTRESETSLVFHPLCRENCARRYKLIQ